MASQSKISDVMVALSQKCLTAKSGIEAMQYSQAAVNLATVKEKMKPSPQTTRKGVCVSCKERKVLAVEQEQ